MRRILRITRRVASTIRLVRWVVLLPFAALLSGSARAEERPREPTVAERGAFVVTFERLVGYSIESVSRQFESERANRHFGVGALLGPRIGFHGVVPGGLSLGASLGTLAILDEGRTRISATVVAPRVGWLFMGDVVGVWPRLGLTWLLVQGARDIATSAAAEVPLVVRLGPHAGLLAGPSAEVPTSREQAALTSIAFTAGLYGAF